jgi:hypothetical protein
VHDREKGQTRKSRPTAEAHARDFYRLDVKPGEDPFFLEKEFSSIEGGAAKAIRHISKFNSLPDKSGMEHLLGFVGLMAVRTPGFRDQTTHFSENLAKLILKTAYADESRFASITARMKRENPEFVSDVSYEEARRFIDEDRYSIEPSQNHSIGLMLDSASTITACLLRRNWMLVIAHGGEFVCSDNPVGLCWSKKMSESGAFYSPGFGMNSTEVCFPLTKRFGLIGIFEELPMALGTFDRKGVASFNNQTLSRSSRFTYSATPDFIWRDDKGTLRGAADFPPTKTRKPKGER